MEYTYQKSIDQLRVSSRIRAVLDKYHFKTIQDLIEYTEGDFTVLHNIGEKGNYEINDELLRLGINVKEIVQDKVVLEANLPIDLETKLKKESIRSIDKLSKKSLEEISEFCNYRQDYIEIILTTLEKHGFSTKNGGKLINGDSYLTIRTKNLLKRKGIYFEEQLWKYSIEEIREFRGVGNQTIDEIKKWRKAAYEGGVTFL